MVALEFKADGLAVLAVYMVCCLLLGLVGFVKKRVANESTMQDHFLAGSGLGTAVLVGTIFAQTFSGWALFGYPATAYRRGLVAFEWLPASIAMYIGALIVTPRLYRIGRPRRFVTTSDVLLARFGPGPLHALATLTMLAPTTAYITIQFKVLSVAIESMSAGRISAVGGAWISAAVMLSYDMLGGMQAVAWTDCLQALLIAASFFGLLSLTLELSGGLAIALGETARLTPWRTATPSADAKREAYSTSILMLSFAIYPQQTARVFAARSGRGLRACFALVTLFPFVAQFLCLVVGWAATPGLLAELPAERADELVFELMAKLIARGPTGYWLSVLLMASAIAATMSTADSGLMAIAAMCVNDLWCGYSAPAPSAKSQLVASKAVTVAACVLVVWASTSELTIIGLAALQQQVMSQVLPALAWALHARECDAVALCAGLVCGLLLTFAILAGAGDAGYLFRGVHPGVLGLGANVAVVVALGALRKALGLGRAAGKAAGAGALEAELFGDTAQPAEPARSPMLWLALAPLSLFSCSAFWRRPGEQDAVWVNFPGWVEGCLVSTVLLALAVSWGWLACWQLDGEDDGEMRPSRALGRPAAAASAARGADDGEWVQLDAVPAGGKGLEHAALDRGAPPPLPPPGPTTTPTGIAPRAPAADSAATRA